MKILHTADWHLGKRLDRFARIEEQKEVLDEIVRIADDRNVDVVIVAGDLFDAFNPPSEAIALLYKTLKKLSKGGKRPVIAIAGNHDSPDRIDAPDALARECGILFVGYPNAHLNVGNWEGLYEITSTKPGFIELRLPQYRYPLRILVTPYANEYRLKTYLDASGNDTALGNLLGNHWQSIASAHCDKNGVNLLMTHLLVMKEGQHPPEEPEDEKPILHIGGASPVFSKHIPDEIQYVALGHLHRYQEMDKGRMPVVYSGSLLSYSFSEAGQTKQVVLLEAEPDSPVHFNAIPLNAGKPLYRKRFTDVDEAVNWLQQNQQSWVELTMVSDHFLSSEDRKRLVNAHPGIVTIIPEVKHLSKERANYHDIDLNQDMDSLFKQYFQHRYGQLPNEEIMDLFKEIRAEELNE